EGFATGIYNRDQGNSVTLEDITLRGQNVGIQNERADGLFARQIDYEGPGTGFVNDSQSSRAVILDSEFRSTAADGDQSAIINTRFLYGRDIGSDGFDKLISSELQGFIGNADVRGDALDEYFATGRAVKRRGGTFQLFESPDTGLDLPFLETPDVPLDADLGNWASPADFGGVPGTDATAALQAAIDSGATTIYIPPSDERWTFDGEIIVRGNVERIIGSESGSLNPDTVIRIADGVADTVILEGLTAAFSGRSFSVVHDSDRTLVMRDVTAVSYEAVGETNGDVFFANVVASHVALKNQDAYARQLNVEGDNEARGFEAKIINDGADFVVLGLKTEDPGTVLKTVNGGRSEVLGSWHNGPFDADTPRFVTEEASLFAAVTTGATAATTFTLVEETRNGETRTGNLLVDGYSAFSADAIADRRIIIDNDEAEVSGAFEVQTGPGGYLGEDFLAAAAGSDAVITWRAVAVEAGTYSVGIRNINVGGGTLTRTQASDVDIAFGGGGDSFVAEAFNMLAGNAPFEEIGTVTVEAGDELFVEIAAADADGSIIADAVRFERVEEGTFQNAAVAVEDADIVVDAAADAVGATIGVDMFMPMAPNEVIA
ncbi:MAG: hypothetical protein AAGD40_01990, partial [Pseudomonadota bacterium]